MISSKEELLLLKDRLLENYRTLTVFYHDLRKCCDCMNSIWQVWMPNPKKFKMDLSKRIVIHNVEKLANSSAKKHDANETKIEKALEIGDDKVVLGIIFAENLIDENESLTQLEELGEFQIRMHKIINHESLDFEFDSPADFEFFKRFACAMEKIIWSQKDTYDRVFSYMRNRYPEEYKESVKEK